MVNDLDYEGIEYKIIARLSRRIKFVSMYFIMKMV